MLQYATMHQWPGGEGMAGRPTLGKAWIGMGIWGGNCRTGVLKFLGPLKLSNRDFATGDPEISAPGPQIRYQNIKNEGFQLFFPYFHCCLKFLSFCLMLQYVLSLASLTAGDLVDSDLHHCRRIPIVLSCSWKLWLK